MSCRRRRYKDSVRNIVIDGVPHRCIYFTGGIAIRNMETNHNVQYLHNVIASKMGIPIDKMRTSWTLAYVIRNSPEYRAKYWDIRDVKIGDMFKDCSNGVSYVCLNKQEYTFEVCDLQTLKKYNVMNALKVKFDLFRAL